jgi:hypothetical protein
MNKPKQQMCRTFPVLVGIHPHLKKLAVPQGYRPKNPQRTLSAELSCEIKNVTDHKAINTLARPAQV